jgi:hypothetical protein
MFKGVCVAGVWVLATSMMAEPAVAQDAPALLVVPSKATLVVGETRTFRAVGKDGRTQHNVHWNVSPEHAAKLTTNADEATINAVEPSTAMTLTAQADGDSSEANIEILSASKLPTGTVIWSVSPLPGCKSEKIIQAVPSANGPDLYSQETCPQGTVIRALTADGREIWRRGLGDAAASFPSSSKTTEAATVGEHLNLSVHSVCDDVSAGIAKDAVAKLVLGRELQLAQKERASDSWVIEEHGFRCDVFFDKAGTVAKKKRTIITE